MCDVRIPLSRTSCPSREDFRRVTLRDPQDRICREFIGNFAEDLCDKFLARYAAASGAELADLNAQLRWRAEAAGP